MKFLIFLLFSLSLYGSGPDFLVIGCQKGGTTSLYTYLKDHPLIEMPKKKELHFFDQNYSKGLKYYLKAFPKITKKNVLTGDITPRYLSYKKTAKRAYTHFPKAKIILLLRNPIDRAFSRYKNDYEMKMTTESFEECVENELAEIGLKQENSDGYLQRGFYAKQLKKWLKYYPKEQFLILISEDFFKNTQECMNKIYTFLELPHHKHRSFPVLYKGTSDLKLKTETRKLLEEFYRPYNDELQELFNDLDLNIQLKWNPL